MTGGPAGGQSPDEDPSFRSALFEDAGLSRDPDGNLLVGGVAIEAIARAAGTPSFVYNAEAVRRKYLTLDAALAGYPHRILYSVKANGNLAVLRVLQEAGAGCDIVSGGELRRALAAGFDPGSIVFSGVGKTREELADACEAGIGQINVESLEELGTLEAIATDRSQPVRTGIRVNPSVTVDTHPFIATGTAAAKFGIPADQVVETALRIARQPKLRLTGLAMHLGSQLLDPAPYREAARKLAGLVDQIRTAGITTLRSLDLGGGLGIRYHREQALEPGQLVAEVGPVLGPLGLDWQVEPGRYLVGSAGLLLATVLYRKHAGGKDFVVVDAGMSDLVRPSHYLAYHDIVVSRDRGRPVRRVDVVGPICESGDFLALDRPLPDVEPGDVLAILGAGAYGFVMGSRYNARPRPAEVLVDGRTWGVARRRETYADLMAGEVVQPLEHHD
ncbi:MAG TPA: diaminopimelate decarboxylase [Gemmatimonadales bacterium]|nr:diaminopimelate decarboxylase [Gemmatimonadales bacterium]